MTRTFRPNLRLVHLDKLRLASRREESEILEAAGGKDPDIIVKNASESKGGVIEKFVKVLVISIKIKYRHHFIIFRLVLNVERNSVTVLVLSFSMTAIR